MSPAVSDGQHTALELYAGTGVWARSMQHQNFHAVYHDILLGSEFDAALPSTGLNVALSQWLRMASTGARIFCKAIRGIIPVGLASVPSLPSRVMSWRNLLWMTLRESCLLANSAVWRILLDLCFGNFAEPCAFWIIHRSSLCRYVIVHMVATTKRTQG